MNPRSRFKRVLYCLVCHVMIPTRQDQFCLKCMTRVLAAATGWPTT